MNYSPEIDHILKENVKILVDWINNERGYFSKEYVDIWYNRYHQLKIVHLDYFYLITNQVTSAVNNHSNEGKGYR